MNFVFLIDNSLSMSQKAYNNLSLIDISKTGIEHFIKNRVRHNEAKYDTFNLFTSDCTPNANPISTQVHDKEHFFC